MLFVFCGNGLYGLFLSHCMSIKVYGASKHPFSYTCLLDYIHVLTNSCPGETSPAMEDLFLFSPVLLTNAKVTSLVIDNECDHSSFEDRGW